jgi:hypothetical protein
VPPTPEIRVVWRRPPRLVGKIQKGVDIKLNSKEDSCGFNFQNVEKARRRNRDVKKAVRYMINWKDQTHSSPLQGF